MDELLQQIVEEYVFPKVRSAEELENMDEIRIPLTESEKHEIKAHFRKLREPYENELETAELDEDYEKMASSFAEVLEICSELPPYERILAVVGPEETERIIAIIEDLSQTPSIHDKCELFVREDRRWSRAQVVKACDTLNILASVDPPSVAAAYEQYQVGIKNDRRQKRMEIKQKNEPLRAKAVQLQMWFPRAEQVDQWRTNPETAHLFDEFTTALQQAREKMRKTERGIMQYVPKRRLTPRTVLDLEANVRRLREYVSS